MRESYTPAQVKGNGNPHYIIGGEEMGDLIRQFNWSATSLGPIEQWPVSLRASVNLILQSPTPILILWGEDNIALYNQHYAAFAGDTHPALLGSKCHDFLPKLTDLVQHMKAENKQGKSVTYKSKPFTVIRNKVQESVWVDLFCSPLLDDTGSIEGSLIITIERTEQVKAEQALQESEERFKGIFNQTLVGLAECDLAGNFLLVNDYYCQMVGRSKEELYQMRMQDITHPDELQSNKALFQKAVQEGISFTIEKRYIKPDGSIVWVNNNVSPIRDANGKIAYMVAACQDITDRKEAERHQKLFMALCENSTDFIGIATPDGEAFYVNPAGRKLVGLDSLEEACKTKLMDYFVEEDKAFAQDVILTTQVEQGHWVGEYRFRHFKTGEAIPVFYNQFEVKDPLTGELLGIATVSSDITQIKRTEEALKESEARFRTMAEASGILIAQADESSNAVYFNQEWLKLTGRTMEDLLAYGWVDLLHPDDKESFVNDYQEAFEKREPLRRYFRLLNKEGNYTWQLAVISPRFGANGTFAGYISSCIDISESKQVEEALAKSEEQFRAFADNIQNLAWMATPEGFIYWYNQRWFDYTNTTYKDMMGWDWEKVHHPDHLEHVSSFINNAWAEKENWELTFPIKGANGEYRWFLTRAYAIKDGEGNVIRWIGTNTDIHEQKVAEQELKKFKIISDYAFDAFILMRQDGTFAYLNDIALKRWGYTREEALHIRVPDVDPIYQDEKFYEVFALAQQHGALPPFETLHKHKDGTIYPVEVNMGGITLEGKPHMFAIARDITDRKQAEEVLKRRNEELQRTNNDLDNFIYTASHDLKAPIANIEGLVTTLLEELPSETIQNQSIDKVISLIRNSIGRFRNTINDLTEITKYQRNTEDDVTQVHLSPLFEEVYLDLEHFVKAANAKLDVDFSDTPTIQFSRKNLRSIIYNLVSNAIKYRSPDRVPSVKIYTSKGEHGEFVLTVEDNGLGMDLAQQSKIFTMFKRLHDHVEGSGVGLYIVKRIVENSGGNIEVSSEIGKGSIFKVHLNQL